MESLTINDAVFFSNNKKRIFIFPESGLEKQIKSLKGNSEISSIFFYEEDFSDEDFGLYLLSKGYESTPLKPTDFYPHFYNDISNEELDLFFKDIVKYQDDFNNIVYGEDLTDNQEKLLDKYDYPLAVFGEYEFFYKGPEDLLYFRIYLNEASITLYCLVLF